MRNLYILTLSFLIQIYWVQAQNILFFNFGEKYEKVIENLNKFPVDSSEIQTANKPLTAYYDGFIAKYYFNSQEKLYKIEVSKNYELKKNAKDAINGALEYFTKIRGSISTSNVKGTKVYRAKRKEHYYEMQEVFYADNDIDVFLVGWSGTLAPEAWIGGEVVSEEDMLDVHDVRLAQKQAKEESQSLQIEANNTLELPMLTDVKKSDYHDKNDNAVPLMISAASRNDKKTSNHLRLANKNEELHTKKNKTESLTKDEDIHLERIIVEEDKSDIEAKAGLRPDQ